MLSDVEVARLRAAVSEAPKPVWHEYFCSRCDRRYKTQTGSDVCPPCGVSSLRAGLQPLKAVVSGS